MKRTSKSGEILEVVSFRVEEETRVKLDQLIRLTGLSQSELLRRLVMSASVQAPRVEADMSKVVSRQRQSKAAVRKRVLDAVDAAFAKEFGREIGEEEADDGQNGNGGAAVRLAG